MLRHRKTVGVSSDREFVCFRVNIDAHKLTALKRGSNSSDAMAHANVNNSLPGCRKIAYQCTNKALWLVVKGPVVLVCLEKVLDGLLWLATTVILVKLQHVFYSDVLIQCICLLHSSLQHHTLSFASTIVDQNILKLRPRGV